MSETRQEFHGMQNTVSGKENYIKIIPLKFYLFLFTFHGRSEKKAQRSTSQMFVSDCSVKI
jgi:hypothetical protein